MSAIFVPRRISQQQDVSFGTVANDDFLQRKAGTWSNRTVAQVKTDLALNNVENTALSSWTGSTNITTLGTIATGTWSGTAIAVSKGGTGATDAATARTNLGLGSLATQNGTFSGTSSGTNTGDQSGANPTASVGLTAINGSAATFMRSDGSPALDVAISPTWTGAHTIQNNALGTTTANRLILVNTTAAAAGAQQVSPSLLLQGNGWATGGGGSIAVPFRLNVLPGQGTTAPTGTARFQFGIGGGYTDAMTLTSGGALAALNYSSSSVSSPFFNANGNSSNAGMALSSTNLVAWFSGSASLSASSGDTILGRQAAANLRQGASDAAAPVAQTSSVQSVVAGTSNTAGVDRTMTCSQGTGTGKGGAWIVQTAPPTASGSSQNALANRQYIYGGETTLTSATATTVATIALASSKYVGGYIMATIHADDGTDFQSITHHIPFSAVNKAGTVTAAIASPSSSGTAASTGTLTVSWTAVASGANVLLKCNADSSLTETTLKVSWQLFLNGDGTSGITAA